MKPVRILMLDDNEGDIKLTQELFKRDKIVNELHCFTDYHGAMDYLKEFRVDVVMVDLNLGMGTGLDFIREAREANLLSGVPVIIFSGSQAPDYIEAEADLLGVDVWVTKPMNLAKLHSLALRVPQFGMSLMTSEVAA